MSSSKFWLDLVSDCKSLQAVLGCPMCTHVHIRSHTHTIPLKRNYKCTATRRCQPSIRDNWNRRPLCL